jgi:hypothetical protein
MQEGVDTRRGTSREVNIGLVGGEAIPSCVVVSIVLNSEVNG